MRQLKRTHKNLMFFEAGLIYCKRHGIEYNIETFVETVFMSETLNNDGGEYDRICNDLRFYRYFESYKLEEITEEEYEMCVDEFNKIDL